MIYYEPKYKCYMVDELPNLSFPTLKQAQRARNMAAGLKADGTPRINGKRYDLTDKTISISASMKTSTVEKVKEMARDHGLTVSGMIRCIVEKGVEEYEEKGNRTRSAKEEET